MDRRKKKKYKLKSKKDIHGLSETLKELAEYDKKNKRSNDKKC